MKGVRYKWRAILPILVRKHFYCATIFADKSCKKQAQWASTVVTAAN